MREHNMLSVHRSRLSGIPFLRLPLSPWSRSTRESRPSQRPISVFVFSGCAWKVSISLRMFPKSNLPHQEQERHRQAFNGVACVLTCWSICMKSLFFCCSAWECMSSSCCLRCSSKLALLRCSCAAFSALLTEFSPALPGTSNSSPSAFPPRSGQA